jgi:hypothetical protein
MPIEPSVVEFDRKGLISFLPFRKVKNLSLQSENEELPSRPQESSTPRGKHIQFQFSILVLLLPDVNSSVPTSSFFTAQ